jgi:hypothetical protein
MGNSQTRVNRDISSTVKSFVDQKFRVALIEKKKRSELVGIHIDQTGEMKRIDNIERELVDFFTDSRLFREAKRRMIDDYVEFGIIRGNIEFPDYFPSGDSSLNYFEKLELARIISEVVFDCDVYQPGGALPRGRYNFDIFPDITNIRDWIEAFSREAKSEGKAPPTPSAPDPTLSL